MSSLFCRIILLYIFVIIKVNASTHHLQPADIIYVDGHSNDDIQTGPKPAKHEINLQNVVVNNNNNNQQYQNGHQGNNQNARYIVQSNGAPTIQTIYESSSGTPNVGYHQTSSESSSQNSENSHQSSSSTTASTSHKQFVQPQNLPTQGYLHTQISDSNGIGLGAHAVNQYNPTVIETSSISPGYPTTSTSSENAFESSSQSSSSSSSKSSLKFNSQGTTINPGYQPEIVQVTTPYSIQIDNNQHGNKDGAANYLPPIQTNYQISSTPATPVQTYESSSESSSENQSSSKSSSQSNQKTSISMSVTPTPYTISVSTPQTYEFSHPSIPITPVPVHQPIPVQHVPIYKPLVQPAPFSVPVFQHHPTPAPVPQFVTIHPAVKPSPFTPTVPFVHHAPPQQPAVQHVPVVTEIPVHEVQEHHGVIEKTINVPEPGIKTQTYEIRRPAIQKQFYDIEERVIVRPAGSVVVEIDHPLSKTAKGGEVIVPINEHNGQNHDNSGQDHNNGVVYTHGTSHGQNSGTVVTENQGHDQSSGTVITENQGHGENSGTVLIGNQGHGIYQGQNGGGFSNGFVQSHSNEGNQGHGIHQGQNGGGYSHGFVQSHSNEENQGHGIHQGQNGGGYSHGFVQSHSNEGNQGHGIHQAQNGGGYSHGFVQSHSNEGHQGNGIHQGQNGGGYSHGFVQSHGDEGNQGNGIHQGQNGGGYSHGFVQSHGDEGNQGHRQFFTTGGNNYHHGFGTFGYYPYSNICDQFNQKFSPVPTISVHHPSIGYGDQQYQPSNHGLTSTTANPISSTTSAPLINDDDDSVVINNARSEIPNAKYIDSTTQPSLISSTTQRPFNQYYQQQPQTQNSTNHQMPHMLTVGDPDFKSPPYVDIQPNGEGANKVNNNNLQINHQQQPSVRGDLHNTGAHTLYTMQSLMNDEYLNPQQNSQPINQQQQQQVNFNQQFPNQQIQNNNNNTQPHIVYAISVRNPNNNVAAQPKQLVFPQQNAANTVQQHTPYDHSGYRQQINQLPQQQYNQHSQQTPQYNGAYIIPGNHQSINHSPLAYSSSYFNQKIPNTPININFTPYQHQNPVQYHNIQNIPNTENYQNPRLNTAPSVFPQQEYEKPTSSYTQQPQNYVNNYQQQQSPSQQPGYTQNSAFTQVPQNYLSNNGQQFPIQQNNQTSEISGNQQPNVKNQLNFIPNNNTQSNLQLNQGSPVEISFNNSDSYPVIDIRNNFNQTNNNNNNNNPGPIRGDIVQQPSDSQPQSSSINGKLQYENGPNLNINYQPNDNQKQFLDFILSNQQQHPGSGNDHDNNNHELNTKSHVISATPAPKYSEPAGERVHTRRIVVNQPLETVQVVHEQIPVTNYKQVKVQQPTVYKTSRVGLKRIENTVPIFIQPQNFQGFDTSPHLQGFETNYYNNYEHHQPVSYSYVHHRQ